MRRAELWRAHGKAWRAGCEDAGLEQAQFRRGLIEVGGCRPRKPLDPRVWVEPGALLRDLTVRPTGMDALRDERAAQLDRLSTSAEHVGELAMMAHLRPRALALSAIDRAQLDRLIGAPWWAGLTRLAIGASPLGKADLRSLAAALEGTRLTSLAFGELAGLGGLELDAILGATPALDTLELAGNGAAVVFYGALGFGRIRSLTIHGCALDALRAVMVPEGIVELRLIDCPIAEEVLARIVRGPLDELEVLEIRRGILSDEGIAVLAAARLPSLRELRLAGNKIADPGARLLTEWTGASPVFVDLHTNKVGTAGAKALAGRAKLARVHLGANPVAGTRNKRRADTPPMFYGTVGDREDWMRELEFADDLVRLKAAPPEDPDDGAIVDVAGRPRDPDRLGAVVMTSLGAGAQGLPTPTPPVPRRRGDEGCGCLIFVVIVIALILWRACR